MKQQRKMKFIGSYSSWTYETCPKTIGW